MTFTACINQWLNDNDIDYDLHDGCCVGYGSDDGPFWDVSENRRTSIISAPSVRAWDQTFLKGDVVVSKIGNITSKVFTIKPTLVAILNYHDSSFFNKLEEAINGR